MSVRDIIEKGVGAHAWDCDTCRSATTEEKCDECRDEQDRAYRYRRTFDPEHVALMEAVIGCVMDDSGEAKQWGFDLLDAANALAAYRRERGLL